jgi:2-dehydro-3-deoxy-D-arabinonate dehydratase
MRRVIRWEDSTGEVKLGVELEDEGTFTTVEGTSDPLPLLLGGTFDVDSDEVVATDSRTLSFPEDVVLRAPLVPPEVWCAGVTYRSTRSAPPHDDGPPDVYDLVYGADRPELFLKDARGRRTVGPFEPIGIRGDSIWNVPEPEIGLVIGERGRILGYTIGNDVSSREIEGANPLYLSQAKVYAGACAIGPAVYVPASAPASFSISMRILDEFGVVAYEGRTSTAEMVRSFEELIDWLMRDNPVPPGSVLLTGTGLVPPESFTLLPGHWVEIHVPEIGTLANPVVLAGHLVTGSEEGWY